ncbi:MAG: hypothetical protein QOC89_5899, partial [Paraburkholderia sp.]|nr:hypothetical protein [Paraburkholderia sp.]
MPVLGVWVEGAGGEDVPPEDGVEGVAGAEVLGVPPVEEPPDDPLPVL